MPRPTKFRKICCDPGYIYFKPAGIPTKELPEIFLSIDEFEAIRLSDLEGKYQADSAENMGVSRQTFGNIINSAHLKIADALVNGKVLKITGGEVCKSSSNRFMCNTCTHSWCVSKMSASPKECPKCGGKELLESGKHIQKNSNKEKKCGCE